MIDRLRQLHRRTCSQRTFSPTTLAHHQLLLAIKSADFVLKALDNYAPLSLLSAQGHSQAIGVSLHAACVHANQLGYQWTTAKNEAKTPNANNASLATALLKVQCR